MSRPTTLSLYSANNSATLPHQRTLRFPTPLDLTDCEVAIDRLQVPISWPNVNALNQTFQYVWPGDGNTYTVVLQPGELSPAAISAALAGVQFNHGHYLYNSTTGVYSYFLFLAFNPVVYRTTITAYPLPSAMPSGFAYGTSVDGTPSWTLPSTPQTPQLVVPPIPSNGYGSLQPFGAPPPTTSFSTLIGVVPGSYPPTAPYVAQYTYAGTAAPSSLVQTVLVSCDRVNSVFNSNTNLLYSFTPSAGYGDLQDEQPPFPHWMPCGGGKVQSLTVSLLDQGSNPLILNDPNIHIRLSVRKRLL